MDALRTAVIVEDDLATQALLAAVVHRQGLKARVAGDGEAGLALILAERPSVLILDLYLPRISGDEVLRRVSQLSPHLLPRTVIVTTDDEETILDATPELRRVRCIMRKPFDIDDLVGEMQECLKSGNGGDGDGHLIASAGSRTTTRKKR